jgi:glycosyltransferase involved in cell wall biosynthesis
MTYVKDKVSICVAQYNRADRIAESIGSLLKQDYDNYRVTVVNDGSPDEKVNAELEKLADERLTSITQSNTGFVGAIRRAIQESDGEFVYIHGAGDVVEPELIRKQVAFLQNNPDFCGVGCYYENMYLDEVPPRSINIYAPKKLEYEAADFETLYNPLGQGGTMYRRTSYEAVGGYRTFFKFAQDHDLWLRMGTHAKWGILPEVLYKRGYFRADGVVTNVNKIIYQKALQEFAIQAHQERKANNGVDSLDKFGVQSGLLRKSSKRLSQFFCWKALCLLYSGDVDKASLLASTALKERPLLKAKLINALCNLSENTRFHNMIVKLMALHPNQHKWAK